MVTYSYYISKSLNAALVMYASGIPGSPTISSDNPADTIKTYVDNTVDAINSYLSNYHFITSY